MSHVTPAELALELNISQAELRERVRAIDPLHADMAESDEWPSEIAADLRLKVGQEAGRSSDLRWVLLPGDTVRRRQIHAAYGGQQQGGISTPRALRALRS